MTEKENQTEWVTKALADFENTYPGLAEKLSIMATQHQIRLSIYPHVNSSGASSSTEEQTR